MNERYHRHGLIDWFDQQKVANTHVVVVGAGAVGNEVLKNLALLGVGFINIYDFDQIEKHNLTRSILFRESDIGRYKAEVAAEACLQVDPNINVKASNFDFWDGLSIKEISDSAAVICCVDNFEARLQLNRLCLMTSIDFINIGIDSRYVSVEYFPFSSKVDCACLDCNLPPSAYSAVQKRYSCGLLRKTAIDEKKIPTTAITSSLAGSVAVSLLLNRIINQSVVFLESKRYLFDSITLYSTISNLIRKEDCFVCGNIDPSSRKYLAKRSSFVKQIIPIENDCGGEIILSEPIVTRTICKLCGRVQEFYESSRNLTDGVTYCSHCNEFSCDVESVDRLRLLDFATIFKGKSISCKYLTCIFDNQQTIIEMES